MNMDCSLYHEKNSVIVENGGVLTSPYDFYRELFPVGSFERKGHYEDARPNGIIVTVADDGKSWRTTLTDELSELSSVFTDNFSIIAPVSYSGRERTGRNARFLYAFTVDLDGVGINELKTLFYQFSTKFTLAPTYVVNSGTGLHLYYMLEEPVPLYPTLQQKLKDIKYALIRYCWTPYTSYIQEPQMQGILQGFRVVGSNSKLGSDYPVVAYRVCNGRKLSLEQIMRELPEEVLINKCEYTSKLSLEKAKELYPEWYQARIIEGKPKGRWHIKRDLYDWWIKKIYSGARYGHRYFCLMCLAIFAMKCDISEEELRKDALQLVPLLNSRNTAYPFTVEDAVSALEIYNENYCTFPRKDIEKISGIDIPPNKRNYRKQADHIRLMNFIRDEINCNKNWREGNGRPNKREIVRKWREIHPDGKKIDCRNDTGLDPKTIRKWWLE